MPELKWNENIDKAYRAGVRNVVLFEPNGKAHPWSGVKRIVESVGERTSTSYYMDGFKYHNHVSPLVKNFTMEVYTYPDVLDGYSGMSNLNGLIIEGQIEKRFNLVYMTDNYDKDGNISGSNINILYNVMAIPEDTSNDTLEKDAVAPTMNFKLDVIPVILSNALPTYKLMISQASTSPMRWQSVIDSIFGTAKTNSILPSSTKLKDWFVGSIFDIDTVSRSGINNVNITVEGSMVFGSPLDGYYTPSSGLNATKNTGYYTLS